MKPANNYREKRPNFLLRSLRGYAGFFRGILWFFVSIAFTAVSGLALVYPLWYLAAYHKNFYSVFSLCVLLVALLGFIFFRTKAALRLAGGWGPYLRARLSTLKKAACFCLALAALYGVILLFMRGYSLAGAAAAIVYCVFLGAFLARGRKAA